MQVAQFVVNVNSEQPDRLISFYKDIVGLTPNFDAIPGAFNVGSATFPALLVEGHTELNGKAKEPQRLLLNFIVGDLSSELQRLEAMGVRFVRAASEEPGVGIFATFEDPDGNFCQLVQFKD